MKEADNTQWTCLCASNHVNTNSKPPTVVYNQNLKFSVLGVSNNGVCKLFFIYPRMCIMHEQGPAKKKIISENLIELFGTH